MKTTEFQWYFWTLSTTCSFALRWLRETMFTFV